ncbi:hypothetical protein OIO90_001373 [Microbotryomycetes sp. JL221]|nr:hypothetical protein OIO90_001373 [Microbotryomycetes sp. JL221]
MSTVSTSRAPISSRMNDDGNSTLKPPPRRRRRLGPQGAATAAALALGSVVTWFMIRPDNKQTLSTSTWTTFKVKRVTPLTQDSIMITFDVPKHCLISTPPTQISSLYVMQPDLQIQRPYTPLDSTCFDPNSDQTECQLVIKRYNDGEMSRYLHRLKPGDDITIRGPMTTWSYDLNQLDQIVFIVGGTGITPVFQFLKSLSTPNSTTNQCPKIKIIYSSTLSSQILLKSELDRLVDTINQLNKNVVSIQYLVDVVDNESQIDKQHQQPLTRGRVDFDKLSDWIPKQTSTTVLDERRKILVCGPEPMIESIAGRRARDLSQGPVGGLLKQLGYNENEVVKL